MHPLPGRHPPSWVHMQGSCLYAAAAATPCMHGWEPSVPPPHLWGMAGVPSALSGRNSSHTPKAFLNAQCASEGCQLLNSPTRHSACTACTVRCGWGCAGWRVASGLMRVRQNAVGGPPMACDGRVRCRLERPRECRQVQCFNPMQTGCSRPRAQECMHAATRVCVCGPHLRAGCPLAVPQATLALMGATVDAKVLVACACGASQGGLSAEMHVGKRGAVTGSCKRD